MPKRTDISSILIIGAGPIVIGQAAEFDYSATQAAKTLKARRGRTARRSASNIIRKRARRPQDSAYLFGKFVGQPGASR